VPFAFTAHVEKYFAAAEGVLTEASPRRLPREGHEMGTLRLPRWNRKKMEELGLADKVRLDLWPGIPINAIRAR